MINCKEFSLDDLMSITAIPLDKYISQNTAEIEPIIASDDFSPVYDDETITIGSVTPAGSIIPILPGTGKVKDTPSDSVAGRLHTVSVSCETDQRDSQVWGVLKTLEHTPRHLILTTRNGTLFYVQSTQDTYMCTTDRDGEKTTVNFRIQCRMGLQEIV